MSDPRIETLTAEVGHLRGIITKAALALTPPTPAPYDYWTDDAAFEAIGRAREILYAELPADIQGTEREDG